MLAGGGGWKNCAFLWGVFCAYYLVIVVVVVFFLLFFSKSHTPCAFRQRWRKPNASSCQRRQK
jgi:hypothetical protein